MSFDDLNLVVFGILFVKGFADVFRVLFFHMEIHMAHELYKSTGNERFIDAIAERMKKSRFLIS